jgi:hypothetical protein
MADSMKCVEQHRNLSTCCSVDENMINRQCFAAMFFTVVNSVVQCCYALLQAQQYRVLSLAPWFKLNIFSCRLQRHFWFECLKKRKLPFLLAFYLILWRHHLAKYDVIVSRFMTSSSHKIWRHHLRNYDVIIPQDMTSSSHGLWRHHLASDDVIIDFSSQIGTFVQSTRNVLP